MVILFRLLLLIALLVVAFSIIKYFFHPLRKLEKAHRHRQFFFLDDEKDVRKNFSLTYKGVMFEGEKYMAATETSFDIITIYVWTKDHNALQGLTKDDFQFIEEDILLRYPQATIEWKSPIKEFLRNQQ
ncbi:sigma-w pathway protein ysdB [Alkalicoccobacillus porphyridii]|uniref:Sigma-w pathway protein ysdB n=2 Tax=Alkalicoccobacillus porphyridii TaxID=2597270 RepID=A0A554A4J3_9BACI|nr:sigma-w pathway protein ysdB [Alkalicoccobacillus porphyridii]